MRDALDVWLSGLDHPVGELRRTSGLAVEFAYAPDVVARQDARCTLSVRLPLRDRPYDDVDCRVFFDNLLPEGEPRIQTAAQHRLDQADIFGLLAVLGADAPGAISVLSPGSPPQKQPGRLAADYTPLPLSQLNTQLTRLAEGRPPAPGLRFSLAGVQSKIAITRLADGSFLTPIGSAPSSHIIKIQRGSSGDANIVLNEFLCLEVFRRFGLPTVTASMETIGTTECLILPRYDRMFDEAAGTIGRLHQEDAAQMLGIERHQKYKRDGLADLLGEFADHCAVPIITRTNLLRATILNWLLSNSDAHLKNFSTSRSAGGRLDMAPLYDVVCIGLYSDYDQSLAMTIGGASTWDAVGRHEWGWLASTAASPRSPLPTSRAEASIRQAERTLQDFATRIQPMIRDISREHGLAWPRLKLIYDIVGDRVRHLNATFGWTIKVQSDSPVIRAGGWAAS